MTSFEKIVSKYKDINLIPVKNYFRIVSNFYHEDGDMYDLFMQIIDDNKIKIFDNGLSLMRLSYNFNMDTENKERIFYKILKENYIENENGNLFIKTNENNFMTSLNQIALTISKITNLDVLNKELISTLFYDYLEEFMVTEISKSYTYIKNSKPANIPFFANNYMITAKQNIYIFPVKDSVTALRVSNSCSILSKNQVPFTSIGVCEDLDNLSKTDRYFFLTNIDKSYPELSSFKDDATSYLKRVA